jgi:NAD-dependent aldehyde dehydrogenases
MGRLDYKMQRVSAVTTGQWNLMRGQKSMGFIDNPHNEPGVRVIAKPIGVINCICPTTNPIITIVGNGMMAVKCRNAAIISPHPKSKYISQKVTAMIRKAIGELGAPEDLLQVVDPEHCNMETSQVMMSAVDMNVATGGPGMVKAVYSSGVPSLGVGQGNTQEIICDDWDDYDVTCDMIAGNRAQDLGVPCTGDQMVHIPESKEAEFLADMKKAGAYVVDDPEERKKLSDYIFPDGGPINTAIVGKSPQVVGEPLGIKVPDDCRIFLTRVNGSAHDDILCKEVLFPFLRYRTYKTLAEAVDAACSNLNMEGAGHNSAIWTHDEEKVEYAAEKLPVCRFHVNQTTLGNNNGIPQTISLGCGFWSGNSISENIEWYHFYQTTRVSSVIPNRRTYQEGDFDRYDVCPIQTEEV